MIKELAKPTNVEGELRASRWRATNRVSTAVAVSYSSDKMSAPQVTLKGNNIIASQMKQVAKKYGVPIHKSKVLANKLSEIETLAEIPLDLYEDMSRVFLSIEKDK